MRGGWLSAWPGARRSRAQRDWLARKDENRRSRDHRAFVGPPELYEEAGRGQLELLVHLGLAPHHYLLDVGCGSLRAGRLLVPYLEPGHYFGIEPEAWLVEDGIRFELGAALARTRRPVFSHDPGFELSRFGRSFDFVLAHSIFSHASAAQISRCLREAARVMEPSSRFAATFVPGPRDYGGREWAHCAHYRPERMVELAEAHGFSAELLDWPHPTSQQWLSLRLRTRPGGVG